MLRVVVYSDNTVVIIYMVRVGFSFLLDKMLMILGLGSCPITYPELTHKGKIRLLHPLSSIAV